MKDIEKELTRIVPVLKQVFGSNLVTVLLYGSFVKGHYIPNRSDINLLILRKENRAEELIALSGHVRAWRRSFNCAVPLVLTEEEITRSTDIYPMEYKEIKENHRVLFGKDIVRLLAVSDRNLRLELENQVKGKLIFLRSALIRSGRSPFELRAIMRNTLPTLLVLLANLLKLYRKKPVTDPARIIDAAQAAMDTKLDALRDVLHLKTGLLRISRARTVSLFTGLIRDMEALARCVDRFKVRGKR
jgi:predicted nucleotidyltransferase